jgi:hypothetical protein
LARQATATQMPGMQQLRQKPQIRTVSLSEIEVFQIEFMRKKVIYLGTGFRDIERLPLATETDRFVWGGVS